MSKYAHNVVSESDQNTPWFKMMRWMGSGQTVLDIGCSSGYFGEKLIESRHDTVWGIDLDEDDAKAAMIRGYQKVWIGDLDDFDWDQLGDLRFDAIIFADVLEHVKDPLACVKAVRNLLNENGVLYASIPNIAHITVRMELFEGNFDYESTGLLDNTHIRFFTKKTVWQLFADAGMEIVHQDATLNDVPDGQVKHHLEALGLRPTPAFGAYLNEETARTFQFIVGAKKSGRKPARPSQTPLTAKLRDDWVVIQKKLDDDDSLIRKLESQLRMESERRQALESQLTSLRGSMAALKRNAVRWTAHHLPKRVPKKHD